MGDHGLGGRSGALAGAHHESVLLDAGQVLEQALGTFTPIDPRAAAEPGC